MGDRWMLVSPERGFVLSETARAIVELCDGTREEEEIVAELGARYSCDVDTIARDVRALLDALRQRALIEDA
jgi:pyrroloquinoline quinone biosynthesis protein D